MGARSNGQRVFILVIVAVFFLTSVAFTAFVIWDQVKQNDQDKQQAELTQQLNDQLNQQQNQQPNEGENVDTSGLQSTDIQVGNGTEAVAGKTVTVHYTGTLKSDGSKFDSSLDRGEPFSFSLGSGQVIKGWDVGVEGMKVGGKRKLVIPASLAYGDQSPSPAIPPNSDLVFEIELLEVN